MGGVLAHRCGFLLVTGVDDVVVTGGGSQAVQRGTDWWVSWGLLMCRSMLEIVLFHFMSGLGW